MSNWRKGTWAFVIWNLLMLLWTVSFAGGIGDCAGEADWSLTVCQIGRALGAGSGVPLIIAVWSVGFIVFGLIWLMSRPKEGLRD